MLNSGLFNRLGVVYVVDGSVFTPGNMEVTRRKLHEAMSLLPPHKPLLLLINNTHSYHEQTVAMITDRLELGRLRCSFMVDFTCDGELLETTLIRFTDNVMLQRRADNLRSPTAVYYRGGR